MDTVTGRVLYDKNAYKKMPMASTTKIMTAIVAIELGNPDDIVTVSKKAANIWGSNIHLKAGQQMKLMDLLYGLMLNSGNDAAIAIAEHIGGSLEGFLDLMNNKASELGAENTCFKSPHGLDAAGHYTTAYDLALITRYALENPLFSKLVGTRAIDIPGRKLQNTNEMLFAYPGADGVKTGYTGQAGRCLVTSATRHNWRIISVVLNCATRNKRAQSSRIILDYAFSNYKQYVLQNPGAHVADLAVLRGIRDHVPLVCAGGISYPLREGELELVEKKVYLPDNLKAPVYAGTEVGYMEYVLDDMVIGRTVLKTNSDVRKKGMLDYLRNIFGIWTGMMREGIFVEP
jgi:D-alanyl-D-alanine carboxypeptidase (penicillin-binding protein 5/6)